MVALLDIFEGLVIGAFAAISIIYTFQTRIPYPTWILQAYDKPWLFVLLLTIAIIMFSQSPIIGSLIILLLGAVWMDGLLFARSTEKPTQHDDANTKEATGQTMEIWPFIEGSKKRLSDPELYGPSLDMVPLPEPVYPVFYGLDDVASGAAPF
jgi:hypothetical protein